MRCEESETAHPNGCALCADWFAAAVAATALSLAGDALNVEPVPGPRVSRIKTSKSPVEHNRYAARSDFIRENCFSHALRLFGNVPTSPAKWLLL